MHFFLGTLRVKPTFLTLPSSLLFCIEQELVIIDTVCLSVLLLRLRTWHLAWCIKCFHVFAKVFDLKYYCPQQDHFIYGRVTSHLSSKCALFSFSFFLCGYDSNFNVLYIYTNIPLKLFIESKYSIKVRSVTATNNKENGSPWTYKQKVQQPFPPLHPL